MLVTIIVAVFAIAVVVYGIIEKDEKRRKKNLTAIVIGAAIILIYLFASNGRYQKIGNFDYFDNWTGAFREMYD